MTEHSNRSTGGRVLSKDELKRVKVKLKGYEAFTETSMQRGRESPLCVINKALLLILC